MNASRGVRQFRHLSGRSLSMRSIRLISSSRMASNGLPLGRILRTTPLRRRRRGANAGEGARSEAPHGRPKRRPRAPRPGNGRGARIAPDAPLSDPCGTETD